MRRLNQKQDVHDTVVGVRLRPRLIHEGAFLTLLEAITRIAARVPASFGNLKN
jgi:hypothetical protein